MPPNVLFLTVCRAATTAACDELGVRFAVFATEAKTVPAAHPMTAVAPNAADDAVPGEYLAMAACMALVAGGESSHHGTACVLPIAPSTAGCASHGVVISPAVVTQTGL